MVMMIIVDDDGYDDFGMWWLWSSMILGFDDAIATWEPIILYTVVHPKHDQGSDHWLTQGYGEVQVQYAGIWVSNVTRAIQTAQKLVSNHRMRILGRSHLE